MKDLLNKVLNQDCLDVLKLIPDESIDLIVTDPPFNINYNGRRNAKRTFEKFANDNLSIEEYKQWFEKILKETERVLKQNSSVYIFIDSRNHAILYDLINKYFEIKHTIVWDKTSIGMGYYFRFQHEFIIYAIKGKPGLINSEKRNVSDIWRVPRMKNIKHPCEKPVELLKMPIEYSSNINDIILDPFSGVFSVPVACKQLNRQFIATELDPYYCSIGQNRLDILDRQMTLL